MSGIAAGYGKTWNITRVTHGVITAFAGFPKGLTSYTEHFTLRTLTTGPAGVAVPDVTCVLDDCMLTFLDEHTYKMTDNVVRTFLFHLCCSTL